MMAALIGTWSRAVPICKPPSCARPTFLMTLYHFVALGQGCICKKYTMRTCAQARHKNPTTASSMHTDSHLADVLCIDPHSLAVVRRINLGAPDVVLSIRSG